MLSSVEFHKDFLPLRISTNEIGVFGQKFTHTLSNKALSALLFEPKNEMFSWRATAPISFDFYLERENDTSFIVRIHGDFSLSSTCVRCLDSVEHGFHLEISTRMIEKEQFEIDRFEEDDWHFDSNEQELSADDASVGYFTNQCIDLGLILRDQIFFEAPDYPHCERVNGSLSCNAKLESTKDADLNRDNPFVKLLKKTN